MFLHVTRLELLQDYKLRLTFSDQVTKEVDLESELYGEIFAPLQDPAQFRQVFLNSETNTIEWPNGADFAPEFLYDIGQPLSQIA
ncbi:DUF2442 domain-containing protein [Phormidium sp. FACHB-1136]|jgi:hypothetical protein|uniref:DUF2442 domain-containing protein n=1 Tax=Phormidium sp. FACHB-1136 TaxID=2692848 RepID=UPI001683522D|nr:DUF2442 domain-containing protein [Phormidium sp. FACHB-1136]MBD2427833.1 DUF2442 domain-containing protein [Phormidium sp. FACHB-1136]